MRTRSGLSVMLGLIGLVKPLTGYMIFAILMGCIGNLFATFITILGGYGLLNVLNIQTTLVLKEVFISIAVFAILRGVLRYSEQACNHFIAFKLLARIRNKVFESLRKLSPAKLDGRDKGNLISILTSDIELLEVFYAHTISPIAIAVITSVFMSVFIGMQVRILGVVALIFYLIVGAVIPYFNGRQGREAGKKYREEFGCLNTLILDNLYGLDEILQYRQGEKRLDKMRNQTEKLESINKGLKNKGMKQQVMTDSIILAAGAISVLICGYLIMNESIEFHQAFIAVISIMSSFGPTAALSSLSNNLNQTLASGDRVLNLLEEEPIINEVVNGEEFVKGTIHCDDLTFAYDGDRNSDILKGFQSDFLENKIYGIHGKSGCGKSTLLKLLMRFYDPENGFISYGDMELKKIKTKSLRDNISYVTQETFLFQDTIENNIKIANKNATREEVVAAAKKASVHDFIISLSNGYDTKLSELGESISGGERQRIGIARAFLHQSDVIFLDEPTSNIDSLNEGIVLKSLYEEKDEKTIILVSHRKSTMGIVDEVITM